jgi:thiol-disulfide isomerase/thioredoxin
MIFHKKFFIFVGLAAIVMLILASCSASAQPDTIESSTTSESGISAESVPNNLPADIKIIVYQGTGFQPDEEITLSELLAQGKPVVLNFWAGLCPPCRLEMPDLQVVNDRFQDRVLLFGLDVGPFTGLGSNEEGRALLQELSITYPAGTTINPNVMKDYQILGMPTTFFITPEGEIFETWTGLLTAEKLTELIQDLLAASTNT